jgi:LysR family glycine cleavage system transcriptional activator
MNPRKYLPSMGLLIAFESCSRLLHFTAAAHELNLTQSAVSRQIRALEEIVGIELFKRERQSVRLTQAGEIYAKEIRDSLRAISNSTLRMTASPAAGSLTLAILPTMGTRWLAPLLPDFSKEHPEVTLNLITRLAPFDLDSDQVHAAIHFGLPEWPNAELDFMFEETVFPACSQKLKNEFKFTKPSDLLEAPLLHLNSRPNAWAEWFQHQGLSYSGGIGTYIDQFAVATQAASVGLGVALLPHFLFKSELIRGELVTALDVQIQSTGKYYLACANSMLRHPPLIAFRAWLSKQVKIQNI